MNGARRTDMLRSDDIAFRANDRTTLQVYQICSNSVAPSERDLHTPIDSIQTGHKKLILDAPPLPYPQDCVIYLLRHGATANNLAHPPLLQGRRSDLELSAEGKEQAAATAHFLQGITFSAIYSSPLRRAVGTATALTKTRDMAVQTVEELTEVDVGDWEGKTWQQIQHETPSQYEAFMSDCAKHPYAGGENLSQVQERVVPALEGLAKQHPGTRIAVVAHNVVNRVAIAHCWQLPLHAARKIHQNNCGLNILTYSQETLKSVSVNAAFHLDAY